MALKSKQVGVLKRLTQEYSYADIVAALRMLCEQDMEEEDRSADDSIGPVRSTALLNVDMYSQELEYLQMCELSLRRVERECMG